MFGSSSYQNDVHRYYTEKYNKKIKESEDLVAEAQTLLDNYDKNYPIYLGQINILEKFQLAHCPEHPTLLTHLSSAKAYLAMNDEYTSNLNEPCKNEFSGLLESLTKLSNAIPDDKTSLLYAPLCQALLNAILLTERFTKEINSNNRSQADVQLVKKKIVALSNNMQAAVDFVTYPNIQEKSHKLYTTTETMLNTIDPDASLHENWPYIKIMGAISMLISIGLMLSSIILPVSISNPLFAAMMVGGSLLYLANVTVLSYFQPDNDPDPLARDLSTSLKAISKNPNPGFWSKSKAVQPLATSTEQQNNNRNSGATNITTAPSSYGM